MSSRADVIVVGSANLDTTFRVPRVPSAGETLLANGRTVTPGGKGANQAVAAAVSGGAVTFIGALGCDSAGETMLESLRSHGVDTASIHLLDEVPTGTATVIVDDTGENLIVVDPGANGRLSVDRVEAALAGLDAPVVLAQLEVPLATVQAAAEASAERTFILNPAPMMAMEELIPLLSMTDVLVPNQSELGLLAGEPTPRTVEEVRRCVAALSYGGSVIVTLGALGAAVFQSVDDELVHLPAPAVQAVDTSGAGDVFCGVLAHGLSQGRDLVDATRRAVVAAAESTTYPGAQLRVPQER